MCTKGIAIISIKESEFNKKLLLISSIKRDWNETLAHSMMIIMMMIIVGKCGIDRKRYRRREANGMIRKVVSMPHDQVIYSITVNLNQRRKKFVTSFYLIRMIPTKNIFLISSADQVISFNRRTVIFQKKKKKMMLLLRIINDRFLFFFSLITSFFDWLDHYLADCCVIITNLLLYIYYIYKQHSLYTSPRCVGLTF